MAEGPSTMNSVAVIVMLIMAVYWPVYADDSAFCNDPAAWEHFDAMVAENLEDVPLQILHALKIGLCVKISQGTISTGVVINLYYDMVDTLVEKRDETDGQGEKEL